MANEAVFEGVDPRFPLRTPDSVMHPGGSKYGQGLRGLTSIDNGLDNSGGGSDGASSAPVTPCVFVLDPFAHLKTGSGIAAPVNLEAQLGAGMREVGLFQPMSAKHAVERPGDLSKGWNAPLHAQTNRGDGEVLLIADHSPINSGTLLLVDHSARNIVSETVAEEVVGETKTSLPLALQGISSWIPGLVVESSDGAVLLDTLTKKAVAVYIASGFQAKGDDERRGVIQRLKGEDGIRIRAEIKGALEAMRGAFVEYEFSTGERNKVIGALNLCESAFSLEQAIRASETAYAAQGVEGFISPLQEIMDRRRAAIYRQFDGVDAPAVSATSTNRRTSVSLLGAGALAIAVAGAAISSHPAVQRFVTNMGFNPPAITLQNPSTEITPTAPIKRVSAVTRAAPLPLSRDMIQTAVQNDIDVVSRPEMRSVNGQLLVSGRTGLYRLTGGGYELVRRYGENESEATHFELSRPSLGRDQD